MTPTAQSMTMVLNAIEVALSSAVRERVGGLGADPLLVFEVMADEQTKVLIGERQKMLQALLDDRIIDQTAAHFLSHRAPPRFVWLVIDWGDEVSTLLHSFDPTASADRGVQ